MISATEADELFPDVYLIRIPGEFIPPGITHTATRQILSTVGLPQYVGSTYELAADLASDIRPVAAVYSEMAEPVRVYDTPGVNKRARARSANRLYYLGFAGSPLLCVDGQSGEVSQVAQRFGVRSLASGLENFLRVLAVVDAGVREFAECEYQGNEPDPVAHFGRVEMETLARLSELEPATAAASEVAWRSFFAEGTEDL